MSALQTRPANTAGRLVLAICLSLMVIMVIGGVASLLGPHVGVAHPLDAQSQRVTWYVLAVLVLVISDVRRCDPVGWIFEGVRSVHVAGVLASGLLVVVSILGVSRLDNGGNNRVAIFSTLLDVAVLLVGVVGGWRRTSRWPLGTLLYAATLALILSSSLRGGHLYGWDIQQEFGVASHTVGAGVWVIPPYHDPYASMLSLTVLPTILHSLLKLSLTAFFELVVPAILALLPLAVFCTIRNVPRWVSDARPAPRPGLALGVVTGLIVSSAVFPAELPGISRQAMALTMLAALSIVLFDRTMSHRPTQVIIGLLIVAISFTHYSTSYLLAGILLMAWFVGLLWSRGWLGTPRTKIQEHRSSVRGRRTLNGALVALALVAAFGWNLGITRNDALSLPTRFLTNTGLGLSTSSGSSIVSAPELEKILVKQLHKTESWIVPVPGSSSVHLVSSKAPSSPGVAPNLAGWWHRVSLVTNDSVWVLMGIALLYGVFRLGRHRSDEYSSDLVGIAVSGLLIGAALRFSGTLAVFYNPERAAIIVSILLAAPATMFLDDLASRIARVSLVAGVVSVGLLAAWATGLSTLFFGGSAPGALTAQGENIERFTATTPELATASWLRNNLNYDDVVQSDRYGQLVLSSEIGSYHLIPEIVPQEVDHNSYIYLSSSNLLDDRSRFAVEFESSEAIYQSNIAFFDQSFYIVYSTGVTRVYH